MFDRIKKFIKKNQPNERNSDGIRIPAKDYTYAPLKSALLPTPTQLKQAIITVDSDPRPMLDTLRKLAIADMHLLGVMSTRKDALLGYDFKITTAITGDNEQRRCEEIRERFADSNYTDAIKNIINGILYGHSVTMPKWEINNKNQYAVRFESIDFVHFAKKDGKLYMIADKNDKDFILTLGTDSDITGNNDKTSTARWVNTSNNLVWVPINTDELIVSQNNPFEGLLRNYIGGLMRPALYLTLLKHYDILDWAKFNELFGMPLRVGKFDALLSSDNAKTILKTAVQNLGADASAVIDKTTEIEFINGKTSGSGDNYDKFANYVEAKQSILLLGQTLTSEVTSKYGSRAVGDVHNLVRLDKQWADMMMVEKLLSKIVEKDYYYNYGEPVNKVYPKFKFDIAEYKDLEMMSTVLSNLKNAGYNPSAKWAESYFGIPQAENSDDEFKNNNPLLMN